MVIEIRAQLNAIRLDSIDDLNPNESDVLGERDPLTDESTSTEGGAADSASGASLAASADDAADRPGDLQDSDGQLATLFGTLWPLEGTVKLDPTVERDVFRRQRDALKQLGYRFDAKGQIWQNA